MYINEPNTSMLRVVDLICHLHRLIFLFVSVTRLQSTAATLHNMYMVPIRVCNSQRMEIRERKAYFSYIIQGAKNMLWERVRVRV